MYKIYRAGKLENETTGETIGENEIKNRIKYLNSHIIENEVNLKKYNPIDLSPLTSLQN